jgi:lysophospholipase L1-like esterase
MRGRGRGRFGLLAAVLLSLGLLSGPGSADPPQSPRPRVLFFGDSLIAGNGSLPRRPVQALTAAADLGWAPVIDAVGGTGYTTGGPHGRPYFERLRHDRLLRTPYDVIVLEGGTNDAHHGSLSRLRGAALATLDLLHRRAPHARVVLVGAFAPAGVDVTRYAVVDEVLRGVAHDRGLQYVSQLPFHLVTDPAFLSRDHYHPSSAGYEVMGRELARALRR